MAKRVRERFDDEPVSERNFDRLNTFVDGGGLAKVSGGQAKVIIALYRYADIHTCHTFPGLELLAKVTGMTEGSVANALSSLKSSGVIRPVGKGGRGRKAVRELFPQDHSTVKVLAEGSSSGDKHSPYSEHIGSSQDEQNPPSSNHTKNNPTSGGVGGLSASHVEGEVVDAKQALSLVNRFCELCPEWKSVPYLRLRIETIGITNTTAALRLCRYFKQNQRRERIKSLPAIIKKALDDPNWVQSRLGSLGMIAVSDGDETGASDTFDNPEVRRERKPRKLRPVFIFTPDDGDTFTSRDPNSGETIVATHKMIESRARSQDLRIETRSDGVIELHEPTCGGREAA